MCGRVGRRVRSRLGRGVGCGVVIGWLWKCRGRLGGVSGCRIARRWGVLGGRVVM